MLALVRQGEGGHYRGILGGPAVVTELLQAPLLRGGALDCLAVRGPRHVLPHLRLHREGHLQPASAPTLSHPIRSCRHKRAFLLRGAFRRLVADSPTVPRCPGATELVTLLAAVTPEVNISPSGAPMSAGSVDEVRCLTEQMSQVMSWGPSMADAEATAARAAAEASYPPPTATPAGRSTVM